MHRCRSVAKSVRKGRTSSGGDATQRLERAFDVILEQIRQDPSFAQKVRSALEEAASPEPRASEPARSAPPAPAASTRVPPPPPPAPKRQKALIDPFALYDTGWEAMLRSHLERLTVEQLRDVIHQYRMDPKGRSESLSDIEELRAWIVRSVENFGMS